ncbi:acetyl-CoA synthetase-like protein [Pholiota conissans]|uniref:Acetyl-CoA synthetase-like protein n=1 Tax=Pholiota conissans TaxID=109636 RepID=A0A9P5YRE8_9AGAR|nr:acetyl-CoA synthetase-like protein [Pholiota conissans]
MAENLLPSPPCPSDLLLRRKQFDSRAFTTATNFQTHGSRTPLPHIPDNLTLAQFMLDYQHETQPARNGITCLVDDATGHQISLEMLRSQTEDLANALYTEYGIGEKDTVLLLSPNHINYPVALWAIHKLGGIVTCSNPQFNVAEIVYQLQVSKTTFIIAHSATLEVVLEAAQTVNLSSNRVVLLDHVDSGQTIGIMDIQNIPGLIYLGGQKTRAFYERTLKAGEGKTKIALLCWSSGTTGKPKAVAVPHRALIANIIQMAAHNEVDKSFGSRDNRSYRPGDVALGVLPFYHNGGLIISLHLVLFCAMTLVVVPRYDFLSMLDSISRNRISHLILVPPQAITFCKHPAVNKYDLKKIKYVMIGAAPVSREIQEELAQIFPTAQIGQGYGLTEAVCTLSMIGPSQKRGPLGSMVKPFNGVIRRLTSSFPAGGGQLLPGIQARVIKPDGSPAQYGEHGELVVKSVATALGYFENVEATEETFRNGWVHTGDQVVLTDDQEIFIFDRLKELIKVRGFQVAPAELEGCLLSHPDITEACVVGIPDDYNGEAPLAFVVLTSVAAQCVARDPHMANRLKESIAKHVEDHKVSYKRLTGGVYFVDNIPRNGSGKIMRRILRERAKCLQHHTTRTDIQPKL